MVYTFIDIETTGLIKFDANNVLIPDLLEFSYLIVDTKDWAIIKYGNLYFYQDHFDIESGMSTLFASNFIRPVVSISINV